MKHFFLFSFACFSFLNLFGQENNSETFNYPIYKGCQKFKEFSELKKCTDKKISDFIKLSIDLELADKLFPQDKSTQFQIDFIINKKGKAADITAKAHKKEMAIEAIKVLKRLPKFKSPGYSNDKPVDVPFSMLMTIYF